MERDTYLEHLARDGHHMATLARADLDAPVPTCPDWTLKDLVEHTGFVHRWQTAAVRDQPDDFPVPETWRFGPEAGTSWSDWLQAGVDEAITVLGAVEPDAPRWTWFEPDQTAGFYHRRITQETAVHRIDAELAATGTATPLEPALAADGIDEMLDVFVPGSPPSPVGGSGETVKLQPTDTSETWLVTLQAEGVTLDHATAAVAADTELRATATDLLLFLWGRDPLGTIETIGDTTVRDRFFAACRD